MPGIQPRNALSAPDIRAVSVFVYALCEPVTGETRYIGRSSSPQARLANHRIAGSAQILAWLADLKSRGAVPTLRIVREVPAGQDSAAAERMALGEHLAHGARLLNVHGTGRGYGMRTVANPTNLGAFELVELGLTQQAIAPVLGCQQGHVHFWMHGSRLPSAVYRAKIEDAFGIYWRLWDQPIAPEPPVQGAA